MYIARGSEPYYEIPFSVDNTPLRLKAPRGQTSMEFYKKRRCKKKRA
jgi:hypothetical protein